MSQLRLKTLTGFLPLIGLTLLLAFMVTLRPAKAQEPEGDQFIFLPIIANSHSTTPPPPPPPPPPVGGGVFPDTRWNTASAGIATDARGGMHLVYTYYESAINDPPTYGVYLYCAAACDEGSNWQGVGLGENVNEIQIALTPEGNPRVLFRSQATDEGNRRDFYYAACNGDCRQAEKWSLIYLTSNYNSAPVEFTDDDLPQRYLALDPNGRPGFVYNDYVNGHYGTFYAFCEANCTQPENWFEVLINQDNGQPGGAFRDENYYYPALAFTPQGQPRIAAGGSSIQDESILFYLACDTGCGNHNNWHSASLYDKGSGFEVSYDIEVDAQGRPRIAFYEGAQLGGQGDRLAYLWCNHNCLNPRNWNGHYLGLAWGEGHGPDLELNAQGRPRIAYALYGESGLGYSQCNSNCESAGGVWQHQVVESRTDLYNVWPVAYPPHCDGGLWDGLTPSLSLDSTGNPRIAYDTTYYARCWYIPETGEWKPESTMHMIVRAVRVNYFPQP